MCRAPSSLFIWSQPIRSRLLRGSLLPSSESSPRIRNIGVSCWFSLCASPFWAGSSQFSFLKATRRRLYLVRAGLRKLSRLLNSATRTMWILRRSWTSCRKIHPNRLALSLWSRRSWIPGTPEWRGSLVHSQSLTCCYSGWLRYNKMSQGIYSPSRRKKGPTHWNLSTSISLS